MRTLLLGMMVMFLLIACTLEEEKIQIEQDPFSLPAQGTSPNCGPEHRYQFDDTLETKEDVIAFLQAHKLKDQYGNNWLLLDNFRETPQGEILWDKVKEALQGMTANGKKIYRLEYNPYGCSG